MSGYFIYKLVVFVRNKLHPHCPLGSYTDFTFFSRLYYNIAFATKKNIEKPTVVLVAYNKNVALLSKLIVYLVSHSDSIYSCLNSVISLFLCQF